MTKKYRPANGTEGMWFHEKFCNKCMRDWDEDGCKIYSDAMVFGINDPDYPVEWIYSEDGKPTCTAFQLTPDLNPEAFYRCPDTPDIFESAQAQDGQDGLQDDKQRDQNHDNPDDSHDLGRQRDPERIEDPQHDLDDQHSKR